MLKSCILCGHIHAPGTDHVFGKLDQMADVFPQVRNQRQIDQLEDQEIRHELKRRPGRPRKDANV